MKVQFKQTITRNGINEIVPKSGTCSVGHLLNTVEAIIVSPYQHFSEVRIWAKNEKGEIMVIEVEPIK